MSKSKKISIWLVAVIAIIVVGMFGTSAYFFHVAQVRAPKTFLKHHKTLSAAPIKPYVEGFKKHKK